MDSNSMADHYGYNGRCPGPGYYYFFFCFCVKLIFFFNKLFATNGFFFSERVTASSYFFFFFVKTKKEILFSLLFTTATKNQIITIFIPFSTSFSKCRITPRGCGFFSTNWGPPFTTPMWMVYRVHNYSSYYRALT
ncbi:hypothetical protein L2E82_21690 [Cichorium intybus]|uniref:Uncharacterized protein n=1 Tax=Cichorium intybus TaxID=13427 RepID=A0ACB9DVS9_CICIN|nr:hypothetical protein L2E82_21690 [Cichorium intybus]